MSDTGAVHPPKEATGWSRLDTLTDELSAADVAGQVPRGG